MVSIAKCFKLQKTRSAVKGFLKVCYYHAHDQLCMQHKKMFLARRDDFLLFGFLWYDVNAALGWWTAQKKKKKTTETFHRTRWSSDLTTCVAGADFDLWTANQFWSPVPLWKILFVIPRKLSVKELSWQAVFTGCGCICHIYHHHRILKERFFSSLLFQRFHSNHQAKKKKNHIFFF